MGSGTEASPLFATDHASPDYDAFLSYPRSARSQAAKIQRFLESFRPSGRRLRVFFDYKDIRGGELTAEIRQAMVRSRTLIVCQSPAAIDSFWVREEIRLFRQLHGDSNIAIALLSGDDSVRFSALGTLDCRRHDLRQGWFLGMRKARTRLELLRLLALVSNVDLRTLRNWDLRQRLRFAAVALVLALLPPVAIASLPIDDWRKLDLQLQKQPLYAIAGEIEGDRLRIASRFRAPGPQGFRDYIRITEGLAGDLQPKTTFESAQFIKRLLPPARVPFSLQTKLPALDTAKYTNRKPAGTPFAGEPLPGKYVSVQPLALTDEEIAQEQDFQSDSTTTVRIPAAKSSLVAVWNDGVARVVEVDGLTPQWKDRDTAGPASPAKGLAIAWRGNDIWLGAPGRDVESNGGLWHSADAGSHWEKVEPFLSVSSVDVDPVGVVTVTENHFDHWRGPFLEPYPSRIVELQPGSRSWANRPAPPFGTRSEVEFCGYLNSEPVVRVDESVFIHRQIALWQTFFR